MTTQQTFSVPPPSARVDLTMEDGAVIRLRRYGQPGATRLVLGHGNGLAINAYALFWLPLAARYDLVAFDMRNHGENPLHTREGHRWENFCSDIEAVFQGIRRHFGAARTVAVMHSLSSIATLEHASRNPGRWDGIIAFDPPVSPPLDHPLIVTQEPDKQNMAARAARRQFVFDTPEQLAEQYRRPAFGRWLPEQAELLALHTVRRMSDGRWTLCCPPEFEASVFGDERDPTLFDRMAELDAPLRIIAGDPASPYALPSAAVAQAARELHGIDVVMVPGTTHFLQFEEPQACRDRVVEFLRMYRLD